MTLVQIKKGSHEIKKQYGHYDPRTQAILDYRENYPLEYFNAVFEALGIEGDEPQYEFIGAVCEAASLYWCFKRNKKNSVTKAYQLRQFDKFKNGTTKALAALESLEPDFFGGSYSDKIMDELEKIIAEKENKYNDLYEILEPNDPWNRHHSMIITHAIELLNDIQYACEKVDRKTIGSSSKLHGDEFTWWLGIIATPWLKYSNIPLTPGHYHEKCGYNSDAVHILTGMAKKIDDSVTPQRIATALRRFATAEAKVK